MRRGELWSYVQPATPDTPRTVLLLSSDAINGSSRPWVLGVEIRRSDPGDLLAVPIDDGRFAYPGDLRRLYRSWFGRREGVIDTVTVREMDNALRAALEL